MPMVKIWVIGMSMLQWEVCLAMTMDATAAVDLDPKLQVLRVCINQPLSGYAPRVTRLDHF